MFQPAVDSIGDSLTVFEVLPDSYDGRVDRDWLDGGVPDHPKFEKAAEIQNIVMGIKDLRNAKILEGCKKVVGPNFIYSRRENQLLWEALISGHKYGVVYLYSRFDAHKAYLHAIAFAIKDGNCDNKRKRSRADEPTMKAFRPIRSIATRSLPTVNLSLLQRTRTVSAPGNSV